MSDFLDRPIDARDRRQGDWSYVEHELWTDFLPVIGREAAFLYQALCYLIPIREREPEYELTYRGIVRRTGMAQGSVHKHLEVLVATGMVVKEVSGSQNAISALYLADLTKLKALGMTEIVKRLPAWAREDYKRRMAKNSEKTVRHTNGSGEDGSGNAPAGSSGGGAQRRSGSAHAGSGYANGHAAASQAPAASGETGVHHMNGSAAAEEMADSDIGPFTKPGGSVHETGGLRSPNGGVAFTTRARLIKQEKKRQEEPPIAPLWGADAHAPLDPDPWKQILAALSAKVNRQSFDTWLRPTRLAQIDGPTLVVMLPSEEFFDVCIKYEDLILEAIETLGLPIDRVTLEFPESDGAETEAPPAGLDPSLSREQAFGLLCRECGVSDPRAQRALETALQFEISGGKSPAAAVEEILERWRQYTFTSRKFAFKPSNFFGQGLWKTPALWGTAAAEQRRRL